jgi:hypothetical protein
MPDAGEAGLATCGSDSILENQMTAIHTRRDPVSEEGHYPVSRHNNFRGGVQWPYGWAKCFAGIAGVCDLR